MQERMHYLNETLLQTIARVLFLHEELMKLPSFPRKALESDLSLNSNGSMGRVSDDADSSFIHSFFHFFC